MPFPDEPGPRQIRAVARRLGALSSDVVFIGGASVPLLITDPVLPLFRATRDVDFVVEVKSRVGYAGLEARLRELGFRHDTSPGAPLCRWRVEDIIVDAMPDDPDILGVSNPWYPYVLASAWDFSFGEGEVGVGGGSPSLPRDQMGGLPGSWQGDRLPREP